MVNMLENILKIRLSFFVLMIIFNFSWCRGKIDENLSNINQDELQINSEKNDEKTKEDKPIKEFTFEQVKSLKLKGGDGDENLELFFGLLSRDFYDFLDGDFKYYPQFVDLETWPLEELSNKHLALLLRAINHKIRFLKRRGGITGITPDQIKKLTPDQIHRVMQTWLQYFSPEQIYALTPDQLRKINHEQRVFLAEDILKMSVEQINAIRHLSDKAVEAIPLSKVKHLHHHHLDQLNRDQVAEITQDQIKRYGIHDFYDIQTTWLTPEQLSAVEVKRTRYPARPAQLALMTDDQLLALFSFKKNLKNLDEDHYMRLSFHQLGLLKDDSEEIREIYDWVSKWPGGSFFESASLEMIKDQEKWVRFLQPESFRNATSEQVLSFSYWLLPQLTGDRVKEIPYYVETLNPKLIHREYRIWFKGHQTLYLTERYVESLPTPEGMTYELGRFNPKIFDPKKDAIESIPLDQLNDFDIEALYTLSDNSELWYFTPEQVLAFNEELFLFTYINIGQLTVKRIADSNENVIQKLEELDAKLNRYCTSNKWNLSAQYCDKETRYTEIAKAVYERFPDGPYDSIFKWKHSKDEDKPWDVSY